MKIIMKPVKMILLNDENGVLTPFRFQIRNAEKEYVTVKIENITEKSEEKLAGNRMLIYRCQSEINGILKLFELKYEISSCKWFLYKM